MNGEINGSSRRLDGYSRVRIRTRWMVYYAETVDSEKE